MKIAISAEGPDFEAKVGQKLGTAQYLLIIDLETMAFEAVPNPNIVGQRGGGMQIIAVAIEKKVNSVLTGYCNPNAESYFKANNIEIITGIAGSVEEAVEQFKESRIQNNLKAEIKPKVSEAKAGKDRLINAIKSSANQFSKMLPVLAGIVLLIGLANTFVFKEFISSFFTSNWALDAILGACVGSVFAGNPINSYIIGGELLEHGASQFAVTALIIAWVNVGLIQLPIEIAALGWRFALVRNVASFILSVFIAVFTVTVLFLFSG